MQKKNHNKRHNARDLPELHPCQPVLFLSPADVNSYIEGTITGPSTTFHSYMIEAQGRTYCHNTPFPRPSVHQGNPIPGPSEQQDPHYKTIFMNTAQSKKNPPIPAKKTQSNSPNKAAYLPSNAHLLQLTVQQQTAK